MFYSQSKEEGEEQSNSPSSTLVPSWKLIFPGLGVQGYICFSLVLLLINYLIFLHPCFHIFQALACTSLAVLLSSVSWMKRVPLTSICAVVQHDLYICVIAMQCTLIMLNESVIQAKENDTDQSLSQSTFGRGF